LPVSSLQFELNNVPTRYFSTVTKFTILPLWNKTLYY